MGQCVLTEEFKKYSTPESQEDNKTVEPKEEK